jgi:DNA-3-methyladenine glycosylase II
MALRPSNTRPLRYPPTSRIRLNHRLAACRHLRAANPMMRLLMDRVGQCTLVPRRGAFAMLCDSIISQQLSIAAATTIFGRLVRLIPEPRPDADGRLGLHGPVPPRGWIVRTESPVCPRLGLAFQDGRVQPRRFSKQSNEEIIAALTCIKGVGRWTVDCF